jgi:alpha-tubulin suppressor-like RCC1 family protein
VTTNNRAYCWGFGLLGDGNAYAQHLRPVAVTGGLSFRQVSAGAKHNCGVTTDNLAYCWGDNSSGQLGDGTQTERREQVRVAGGRKFSAIDAGSFYTCGLSYPDKRAYCWGANNNGQLGNGTVTARLTPVAVVGDRAFRQVGAG